VFFIVSTRYHFLPTIKWLPVLLISYLLLFIDFITITMNWPIHVSNAVLTKSHETYQSITLCRITIMLWSQTIYEHRTASISPRFYGARLVAGRILRFFINFLDIVWCPVKFRYYLKFHSTCTAFGRVIEGN